MNTVQLSSFVRPIGDTGNTSVEIAPQDFVKQLMDLNIKPEFEYYTRDERGHFRFYLQDGNGKVTVAISKAALPNVNGNTIMEKLDWCLKNTVLRSGISSPEFGGHKFLTFGVRGEGGNLQKGTLSIQDYVKAFAGGAKVK